MEASNEYYVIVLIGHSRRKRKASSFACSRYKHQGPIRLLPQHVSYGLEKINEEMRDWINGLNGRFLPVHCRENEGVVWLRKFSNELAKNCDCSTLEHVLATIPGVKRMIMGQHAS